MEKGATWSQKVEGRKGASRPEREKGGRSGRAWAEDEEGGGAGRNLEVCAERGSSLGGEGTQHRMLSRVGYNWNPGSSGNIRKGT